MAVKLFIMMSVLVRCLLLARPLDNPPEDWNEIVMTKQMFNDQGKAIGDLEVQVFVNPRKCDYTLGKFIKLPCIDTKVKPFSYPKIHPEQQDYENILSHKDGLQKQSVIDQKDKNQVQVSEKDLVDGNKKDFKLITEDSLLDPPRLACPKGYRLDMFDKCREAVYW